MSTLSLLSPQSIAAADSSLLPRAVSRRTCRYTPSAISSIASSSSEQFGAPSLRLPRVFRRPESSAARRLQCESNLADYTTVTAAIYGTALVGGGTFACESLLSRNSHFPFTFQEIVEVHPDIRLWRFSHFSSKNKQTLPFLKVHSSGLDRPLLSLLLNFVLFPSCISYIFIYYLIKILRVV